MIYQVAMRPARFSVRRLLLGASIVFVALVLAFAVVAGLIAHLVLALLALGVAALVFFQPLWAAVFFAAFTPLNRFVIAATLYYTQSDAITKLVQLWKDGIIAVLLLRVLYDAVFSSSPKRLRYLDFVVAAFIALSLPYLFYAGPQDVDDFTRLQGFRTDASFLFAYFVGRGLAVRRKHVRWLVLALVPGSLIVAAVSLWQFAQPAQANQFFATLGLSDFSQLQGASGAATAVRERSIAGVSLARASGLLMGDLALSFYQLVLVAISGALYFEARSPWRRALCGTFLLLMIGTLVLTITRSAILSAVPVVVVAAVLARAYGRLVLIGAIGACLAVAAITLTRFDVATLQRLADPNESSVQGHLSAAEESFAIIEREPLGQGLGTAGTIGQRYLGARAITNESWYLQLATEMGVAAASLYLLALVLATGHAVRAYRRSTDVWLRVLALTIATSGVGFLLLGNFLHAWENTVLSMLFWLYAGIVLRASVLDRSPEYRR